MSGLMAAEFLIARALRSLPLAARIRFAPKLVLGGPEIWP